MAYVRAEASPNEVLQHDRVNASTVATVKYLHKRGDPAHPTGLGSAIECHPRRHARRRPASITKAEPGVLAGAFGDDHQWAWLCVRVIATHPLQRH